MFPLKVDYFDAELGDEDKDGHADLTVTVKLIIPLNPAKFFGAIFKLLRGGKI